jgi:hypothetical protein
MSKERKARGDSKLDALLEPRRNELAAGMLDGWTYDQAREWCRTECGVKVALSAFTPFYRRHVEPLLRERKRFAALTADTLVRMAADTESFDAAALVELKEYAYRLIRTPETDPKEARAWMETLIRAQAGQRDARKVALLEKKAAQADDAAGVAKNATLTPEEKAAELRRIFRMG